MENENRDCYFHTIYFCWKENLTLTPPFLIEWSQIEERLLSSLKAEIWWKGTSHSNQVVVLGLVVVVHTDHHVCIMVQKLGNLFRIMHPTTNLVGCVIQKRNFSLTLLLLHNYLGMIKWLKSDLKMYEAKPLQFIDFE